VRIVPRQVPDHERIRAPRPGLDVPQEPRQMTEMLLRQRPLRHLGPVDEIDLMPRHVPVQKVIPDRPRPGLVRRDDVFRCPYALRLHRYPSSHPLRGAGGPPGRFAIGIVAFISASPRPAPEFIPGAGSGAGSFPDGSFIDAINDASGSTFPGSGAVTC